MIKAVFLDIDGTMVSFKTHRVPDNTKIALLEARNRGVKIFVCTGRSATDINNLDDMEFDGYITVNGAFCMVGEKVIFKKSIAAEDIRSFIRYVEEIEPISCFFVEKDKVSANMINEQMKQMMKIVEFTPRPTLPIREFADKEIFQLTAFFSVEHEEKLMKHLPGCVSTRWYPTFADIVACGVDKSVGMQKFGEYFGFVRDEMMAIGDGGNDIPMIKYAGVGVAMGNADDEVKLAADFIASSVDEDGVGNAFRYYGIL